MEHINRAVLISELLEKGRVLVIYGPRRVGKTTLVGEFVSGFDGACLSKTGDDVFVRSILSSEDLSKIKNLVADYELFFIDEAQQVENVGKGLKMIVDSQKDMMVIATGSSSFDLANKVGEPLLGRKRVVTLYPVSVYELLRQLPSGAVFEMRDELLLYGGYPKVLTESAAGNKIELLQEMVSSVLFKDIFVFEKLKSPQKILDLVRMLAYQIGQPVSIESLANDLDIDRTTVERYLDLLEKSFVIFRLGAYSRNLRNAIKYKRKYFFWDTGIRNAVINNFQPVNERNDIDGLWENFCILERMKKNAYSGLPKANYYFYQGYQSNEIDLIEEINGHTAFECKWKSGKSPRNKEWNILHPDAPIGVIDKENFIDYLG